MEVGDCDLDESTEGDGVWSGRQGGDTGAQV